MRGSFPGVVSSRRSARDSHESARAIKELLPWDTMAAGCTLRTLAVQALNRRPCPAPSLDAPAPGLSPRGKFLARAPETGALRKIASSQRPSECRELKEP